MKIFVQYKFILEHFKCEANTFNNNLTITILIFYK